MTEGGSIGKLVSAASPGRPTTNQIASILSLSIAELDDVGIDRPPPSAFLPAPCFVPWLQAPTNVPLGPYPLPLVVTEG
jgi:hypothetical protein